MWKSIVKWEKAFKLLPVSNKSIKAVSGRVSISMSQCNSSRGFSGQDTSTHERQESFKLLPGWPAKEVSFQLRVASCTERIVPSVSLYLINTWKIICELYFTITVEGRIADDTKLAWTVTEAGHKDLEQLCLLQKWDWGSGQWIWELKSWAGTSKTLVSHSSCFHPHSFGCGDVDATPSRTKTSEKSKLTWRHKEMFLLV